MGTIVGITMLEHAIPFCGDRAFPDPTIALVPGRNSGQKSIFESGLIEAAYSCVAPNETYGVSLFGVIPASTFCGNTCFLLASALAFTIRVSYPSLKALGFKSNSLEFFGG